MSIKNLRRLSVLVTAQTAYNLIKLAQMAGYKEKDIGKVIDKLVRDRMIEIKRTSGGTNHESRNF